MKQFLLVSLILLFASYVLPAQILKGRITNQSGDPVQYSTVYIQELRQGTTSNTKGDYEHIYITTTSRSATTSDGNSALPLLIT